MRRAVLTVDLDCDRCGGTGRMPVRVRIGPVRYGGHTPTRTTVTLCRCVLPAPVYSEADGGVSIGAPVKGGEDGE